MEHLRWRINHKDQKYLILTHLRGSYVSTVFTLYS